MERGTFEPGEKGSGVLQVRLTIAAYASSEQDHDILVAALREAGPYEVLKLSATERLPQPSERILATVLFCPRACTDSLVLLSRLQDDGDKKPLLVIGSGPPPSIDGVSLWIPSLPPASMLRAIVNELIAAGSSVSWSNQRPPTESEGASAAETANGVRPMSDMVLGESAFTSRLRQELDRLAPSSGLVLVTGENGTGKELVARALHYCGPRAAEPFVAVNCTAPSENVVEEELFGPPGDSLADGAPSRGGAIEAVRGGTLFIGEIADMPPAAQAKLLRVLETNELPRVGWNEPRQLAARIIAATSRDLETEVKEGRFLEDLHDRLKVYPIHLEPLRRRPEDIPAIVTHHLRVLASRENRPTPRFTPAALEHLLGHSWPGNVRELIQILGRALLAAPKNVIDAEHIDLPRANEDGQGAFTRYRDAKHEFDRDYYTRLIRLANGNIAFAARLADKTRKEVYDALKRVGLNAAPYRQSAELHAMRSSRQIDRSRGLT